MRAPKCCKQKTILWAAKDHRTVYKRCWKCLDCGREIDLYRWPWTWFWVRVEYSDCIDGVYKSRWWVGRCAELQRDYGNELLFVAMPFNVLVDWTAKAYHWLRYRFPGQRHNDMQAEYLRGVLAGRLEQAKQQLYVVDDVDETNA